MMRYLSLFLAFYTSMSFASGGPTAVDLTPELAENLGFNISVTQEGATTKVKMKGPSNSPSGCPASRSGSFLLDAKKEDLFIYITELAHITPESVGYYTNPEHTMGVFIDYLCSGEQVSKSIRYTVPSTSDWLKKSKSIGRNKVAPIL